MTGTYVGALFHRECYTIVNEERIYLNIDVKSNAYFQVTSKTVFEKQLLEDISNNIVVNATLQSRANVYDTNFREVGREVI